MQPTTGRSKSFKALSMAQPIRKDIEQTLNQLEHQKRRFLATQRQQATILQQIETKRKQLNQLKAKVPQVKHDEKRSTQTNFKYINTDRTYETVLGNIQKLKEDIDGIRKRTSKCKIVNQQMNQQYEKLVEEIEKTIEKIVQKQKLSEEVKQQIINYREMNIKNLNEFKKSHAHLTKSHLKEENQRKRMTVTTSKSFIGAEDKKSKTINFNQISESRMVAGEGKGDIMADSVPIAKARVNVMVHRNKEKIKIAENYMKFGEGLENMFKIMKQYKGRDDVDYLAEEFVKKEKQIQKLGQYIGKLQYRIVTSNKFLSKKNEIDNQLQEQLKSENQKESDKHYIEMSKLIKEDVENLKAESLKMNEWMKKIGEILCPLAEDNDFSRGNAINVIGKIQQKLNINRSTNNDRRQYSPSKQQTALNVEPQDHHQKYAQLLSYEKMKEYADQYIKNKKAI